MEWCIRQLHSSSFILYSTTSIVYNHYADIYPLLNILINKYKYPHTHTRTHTQLFSKRSEAVAAWMSGLEISHLQANLLSRELMLNTDISTFCRGWGCRGVGGTPSAESWIWAISFCC